MNTLIFLISLMASLGMPAPYVDIMADPGYIDSEVVGCPIWFVQNGTAGQKHMDEVVVVCEGAKRLIVIKENNQ